MLIDIQEPAPMTEDLLEEQSEALAKLGTSAEGANLRARMQSACLLSDMESFKVSSGQNTLFHSIYVLCSASHNDSARACVCFKMFIAYEMS